MNELEDLLEIAASRLAVCDIYIVEMEGLLETVCEDLERDECYLRRDLREWYAGYKDRTL